MAHTKREEMLRTVRVETLMALAMTMVLACDRTPEVPLRLQGTVTAIGSARPVKDADVVVEWPAELGGGTSTVKTDEEGHFVAGRSVRTKALDCRGLVITVRKEGYASAYNQSHEDCSEGHLTADFKLFPIPG
jgi:hypothetical protein